MPLYQVTYRIEGSEGICRDRVDAPDHETAAAKASKVAGVSRTKIVSVRRLPEAPPEPERCVRDIGDPFA